MIHAKLRHIIESNSSEEGVSSCSSVAGDEIHDSGVPGSFSWFRSEGATSLDALHCVGCESLLVPQGVQELPYRWVLAGYQRVEGVVVGLQGVGCPGRASSRSLQGVPHLDWEIWFQASCCSDRCSNPCFLKVSQERKLVLQEMGKEEFKGRYNISNRDESQGSKFFHSDTEVCIILVLLHQTQTLNVVI